MILNHDDVVALLNEVSTFDRFVKYISAELATFPCECDVAICPRCRIQQVINQALGRLCE